MTGLSGLRANEEAGAVSKAEVRDATSEHGPVTDEAMLQEMTERLKSAVRGLDRGRALFIVVSALVGDHPDQELAVADPDTGRVLAYLLPAARRHVAVAAGRARHHADAEMVSGRTLSDLLESIKGEVA
jgi:hypothetical protein